MDAPPMSPATAAPPSDAAAGAGAGRSAPEILKGGLANLSENPFGWLFGKPSPLYSTEPSADRLQWEGDKAPAASPPSPPPLDPRVRVRCVHDAGRRARRRHQEVAQEEE